MKIKATNITYDLFDKETNPNNDILPEDLDLPSELLIEEKSIKELYGDDFNANSDINELITCHTGFEPLKFDYEVISS